MTPFRRSLVLLRSGSSRAAAVGGLVVVAVLATAPPASAHVTITPSTTVAGAYAVLEVSVPHGCDGSPTTEVTIRMPPEINAVTPTRNPLWEVEKQVEELDPPATDAHGNTLEERVASVTYRTDEPLPDGYRDTFELSVQLPDTVGVALVFPTIQRCAAGEAAWIEVAADGQDTEGLERPAPVVVVTAADEESTSASPAVAAAGPVAVSTDADTEDGNALPVVALVAGLVGVLLGGAALVRQRRRA